MVRALGLFYHCVKSVFATELNIFLLFCNLLCHNGVKYLFCSDKLRIIFIFAI